MKYGIYAVPALCLLTTACNLGGNVYPMKPQDAYDKLVAAPLQADGKGPFGRLETDVSGDGSSTVYWSASGSMASVKCEANLAPEGEDKTKITAYCGGSGAGEGAAAGMAQGLMRKALIEHIDSTLRGRPYDPQLAFGSTAGSWPEDPRQADSSYAGAATEALKMDRDMHKMQQDMEAESAADAEREQQERVNSGVNFRPGEPMVNPGSSH
jgi:hypothetical protein